MRFIDQTDEDLAAQLTAATGDPEAADGLERREVLGALLETMTITELKALPEVVENEYVKRNRRDDVIAAAMGEAVEAERETNARAAAKRENEAASDLTLEETA